MEKQPLLIILGPTASGKSALSITIAKEFNCEIISADSMQIYKGMTIATAKPLKEEMQGIKHYMLDFLDVDKSFSVADYVLKANECIDKIFLDKKLPLVVGGTGLYINSLVDNIKFDETTGDEKKRKEYFNLAKEKGNHFLWEKLNSIDPESAKTIHENNVTRVVRAIEVYEKSGIKLSEQKVYSRLEESRYLPIMIGLNYKERETLYQRINKRVDIMIENGLIEEAREVYLNKKLKTAYQAIGYKELIPFLENKATLEECVDKIKQETRRYAKRQLTWFRRDERIKWFYLDEYDNYLEICENIKKYIAKCLKV